jgi:hypothetical protein
MIILMNVSARRTEAALWILFAPSFLLRLGALPLHLSAHRLAGPMHDAMHNRTKV